MTAIDHAALDRLLRVIGGDPADLQELFDSFLDESPGLLANLSAGIDAADAQAVKVAAHTLKSTARDFGAVRLAEFCADLETAAAAGGIGGAVRLLPQIRAELHQAIVEISRLRSGGGDGTYAAEAGDGSDAG